VATPDSPEPSPTDLLVLELERAREMAAEVEEACRGADPAQASRLHARAAVAREHVQTLAAVVQALTKQANQRSHASIPLHDAEGFDLRPSPLSARTPKDFVACLRAYRKWSGEPSLRTIAERSGNIVSHSTIRAVLGSDSLPSQASVRAIIAGCGGTPEEERTFVTAWRLLALAAPPQESRQTSSALPGSDLIEAGPGAEFIPRPVPRESSQSLPAISPAQMQSSPSFAGLLRRLRTEAQLTQEEFAEASGVQTRTISDLERGVARWPQRETARLLADALHLIGVAREEFMAASRGRPQTP
jgi:DNA-binding XRE family transcriptional regulator